MDEYGFVFSGLEGLSEISSDFSNYSVVHSSTVYLRAGLQVVSLGVSIDAPLVMVRHPGVGVGFIRYTGSPTNGVEIYATNAGYMSFYVFTARQTLGDNGHGLLIRDATGVEVYHSDLRYLNIDAIAGFGSSLNGGYYLLGSYLGLRYEYTEESFVDSQTFPIYGYTSTYVCGSRYVPPSYSYQCSYSYPAGYTCENILVPGYTESYCEWQQVYGVVSYYVITYSSYWLYLRKYVQSVLHASDDRIHSREYPFWYGEVFSIKDKSNGFASGDGLLGSFSVENNANIKTAADLGSYVSTFTEPEEFSTIPNILLVSSMRYA